ncbi:MAG TPA: heparan-alpha-glucosaminide N-acetyltransferase [Casimicrobiaceae bacterium]|nr:heparan-alpha-glucosaminide N-acetyltransferase [Casimicrobiaceae bacterium]
MTRRRAAAGKARAAAGVAAKPRKAVAGKSPNGQPATHAAPSTRIAGLDALRGLAIVAMIAYHLCFDLRYFGVTHWDFEHDLRWLTARTLILSSFLLIAGISAVLARRQASPVRHWLRHIGIIAGAALLVSAGSWLMFPRSLIWFGVLHAIAVSLLLARPLYGRPVLAALVGIAVIVAGSTYANAAFDNRTLGWIGFMTAKPVTEDYVPLFPWTGVLLLGVTAGHALVRTRFAALAPLARLPAPLQLLGRHSLIVYLLHQPLLLGLLWLTVQR